jgi:hypothetical protein
MENRQVPPWGKDVVAKPVAAGQPITFQASPETSDRMRSLAAENSITDSDLVKLGLALVEIITTAKKEGNRLAIVGNDGSVVQYIAGL